MMKQRSKRKKTLMIIAALALIFFAAVGYQFVTNIPEVFAIQEVDLATLPDGVYEGRCDNGLVAAQVRVTVTDQQIQAIELLAHDNGLGKAAEIITDQVVAAQSLLVDAVSGATYSSSTILKAIENALHIPS